MLTITGVMKDRLILYLAYVINISERCLQYSKDALGFKRRVKKPHRDFFLDPSRDER